MKNIYPFPMSTEVKTIMETFIGEPETNLMIKARAGVGKSTLAITMIANIDKPNGANYILCYNKSIKIELEKKLKDFGLKNGKAQTVHSLGYSMIRSKYRRISLNDNKAKNFANQFIDENFHYLNGLLEIELRVKFNKYNFSKELVTLCRYARIYFSSKAAHVLKKLRMHGEKESQLLRDVAQMFLNQFFASYSNLRADFLEIDYLDMIFIPVLDKLEPTYEINTLILDEAQDHGVLNQMFISLLNASRYVLVGDPEQAIMMFTGSLPESMNHAKKLIMKDKLKEFPLTTCYRCPELVIDEANIIVPDIKCGIDKRGLIKTFFNEDLSNMIQNEISNGNTVMVLARTNNEVIRRFILAPNDAYILNDNLKFSLLQLIGACISNFTSIEQQKEYNLNQVLRDSEITVESLYFKKIKESWDILQDVDAYFGNVGPHALKSRIRTLFDPKGKKVLFSTVHKVKGRESDVVFFFNWKIQVARLTPMELKEARNIYYVAVTRAKKKLYISRTKEMITWLNQISNLKSLV